MADVEAEARVELEQLAREMEAIRRRLLKLHGSLPVSPREDVMLLGEEDPDFPTEVRAVIECLVNDRIVPAIQDLKEAAAYGRGKKTA